MHDHADKGIRTYDRFSDDHQQQCQYFKGKEVSLSTSFFLSDDTTSMVLSFKTREAANPPPPPKTKKTKGKLSRLSPSKHNTYDAFPLRTKSPCAIELLGVQIIGAYFSFSPVSKNNQ